MAIIIFAADEGSLSVGHDASLVYKGEEYHTLLETLHEGFHDGIHRIAVFDAHGKVIDVVSQTDVIRHVLANLCVPPLTTSSAVLNHTDVQ